MAFYVGTTGDDSSSSSGSLNLSTNAPTPTSRKSGPTLIQYTPSEEVLQATGMTAEQYDTYRHYMAKREAPRYDYPFKSTGSKTTPEVGGQYQQGLEEIADAAKYLKRPIPTKEEFLKDDYLQEQIFDAYTLQHAKDLSKYSVFSDADPKTRAAILAGTHLGGVGDVKKGTGVLGYLAGTGNSADKWNTPISSYVEGAARAMGAPAVGSVSNWIPSSNAIASEQKRSNTDVVDMSPEEYLSLLPPIGKDESSLAKRDNLRKSLAAGDEIESIPSLEVKPVRGDLKVVDHDGRNRAHAAIEAGLDTIPVSIRGVGDATDYKSLIGQKTVPIDFNKVPVQKPEQAQAQLQQAQPIQPRPIQAAPVGPQPQAQAQIPPAVSSPQNISQPTVATSPIPPVPPTQTKPDFYPQIVAGINKDILNPAAQGYRGVSVPNPTDNVTAGQRIANTNATSAGQVGLPPTNALTSVLSALNPISSAQAAEGPVPTPGPNIAPPRPSTLGPSAGAPIPPQGATPTSTTPGKFYVGTAPEGGDNSQGKFQVSGPTGPDPRQSYFSGDRGGAPGLLQDIKDIGPPIANALSPMVAALPAAIAAFRQRPMNFDEWKAARDKALAETQLPETETGRKISAAIGKPGELLGMAFEKVLGDKAKYLTPVFDLLAPASMMFPGIGSAVTAPIRPIANRIARTPEMADTIAINKAYEKELKAGGKPVSTIDQRLQEGQASGIPVTPRDYALPGEAVNALFTRSMEQSPAARGVARDFAENRTKGTEVSPGSERAGGSLERTDQHVTDAFGSGSVLDKIDALNKSITTNTDFLNQATKRHDTAKADLDRKINDPKTGIIAKNQDLNKTDLAKIIKADPDVAKFRAIQNIEEGNIKKYNNALIRDNNLKASVDFGQKIFSPTVRSELIENFVKKATPEQLNTFRMSVGDAVRDQFRRVRELGSEYNKVVLPQNMRNKLTEALGSKVAADDFLRKMDMEDVLSEGSENILSALGAGERAGLRAGAPLRRAGEFLGHMAVGAALGHGLPHIAWQAVRGARNIADYLAYGGGFSGSRRGLGITNALLNPRAAIDTTGKGLLQVPQLPARRQAVLNTLPYTPGLAYSQSQDQRVPQQ